MNCIVLSQNGICVTQIKGGDEFKMTCKLTLLSGSYLLFKGRAQYIGGLGI